MAKTNPARSRLADTPLLDREIKRIERLIRPDGARHDLISFMAKMNGQTERINGNRLTEIIHRARLPNAEVLLTIQKWMNKSQAVEVKR